MSSTLGFSLPNIHTRVVGMKSWMVLFRYADRLNHVDMTTPYDDQYWYIKPGKDEHAGHYLIVSDCTNRALVANPSRVGSRVGTWHPVDKFQDQHFDVDEKQGQ
jgi:hypothetical protein